LNVGGQSIRMIPIRNETDDNVILLDYKEFKRLVVKEKEEVVELFAINFNVTDDRQEGDNQEVNELLQEFPGVWPKD